MNKSKITIRPASIDDASLIAQVVVMGIGSEEALQNYCGEHYLDVLTKVACSEHAQYSYHNALVAEIDGRPVGGIVGYDGGTLYPLREGTYSVIRRYHAHVPTIIDETSAGEFYVDSVAVLPDYRGCGVGRALLDGMCTKAFSEGHRRVGLLVDCDNPAAERLYASIGFKRINPTTFLGHQMWHMQKAQEV